jgi:hypothetical protein
LATKLAGKSWHIYSPGMSAHLASLPALSMPGTSALVLLKWILDKLNNALSNLLLLDNYGV